MANKGITFERQLKQDLESLGYSVMRGAGSKGEFFGMKVDLIASKDTSANTKTAGVAVFQLKVKQIKKPKKEEIDVHSH